MGTTSFSYWAPMQLDLFLPKILVGTPWAYFPGPLHRHRSTNSLDLTPVLISGLRGSPCESAFCLRQVWVALLEEQNIIALARPSHCLCLALGLLGTSSERGIINLPPSGGVRTAALGRPPYLGDTVATC
ncbi:hypothetical protein VNO77_34448 [Canavalia gladiata]|uniref:Uncharacterized protein n=1 Tax=Canavalia gladiata TaxID=3824 RepID=A0AAN9KG65_CANGL